ncbi:cation transporter [Protaetiibacter intestinalis]|uniref:Cation efflux family transporter n=1 Tax=Protaetiibacter intestinalis TaxID=2419774 RepID=A0A387BA51_9MICO|nr:cation transporter [Protaetiibacter intestinalis]AYF98006.1 cation efflux family transporter [Protaetiibacter intestinalis]
MAISAAREVRILTISLAVSVGLALVALGLGLALGIRVLVFDGAFGVIGIATTWMAIAAVKIAREAPTRLNPFGRAAVTPLVVAAQGVAALAALVVAVGDAVIVILDGGEEVQMGAVVAYGIAVAVVSTGMAIWLGLIRSDLVHAESLEWRGGAIRAAMVAVAAVAAILIAAASWHGLLPYVDPVLVLASCALVAPMPISLVRTGVRELLEGAPPPEVSARVTAAVESAAAEFGLHDEHLIRSSKLGNRLNLEVLFRVEPGCTIERQDLVRRHILRELEPLEMEIWSTVELTTEQTLD